VNVKKIINYYKLEKLAVVEYILLICTVQAPFIRFYSHNCIQNIHIILVI